MGITDAVWKATKWKIMKKHLGYSDAEMQLFRDHPRNADVLSKVPSLMSSGGIIFPTRAS
jgi:hypothetical protein